MKWMSTACVHEWAVKKMAQSLTGRPDTGSCKQNIAQKATVSIKCSTCTREAAVEPGGTQLIRQAEHQHLQQHTAPQETQQSSTQLNDKSNQDLNPYNYS